MTEAQSEPVRSICFVSRHPIGEMPAWVFLELSSFGAFADFYLFCANRWGDSGMRDEHYMLRRANSLRNAAAHSSAIVNGLGSPLGAPQLRYPAPLAAALGEIDTFRIGRCRDVRGPDAPHHIGSSDLDEHGLVVAHLAE